jgi:hypothetical protein
MDQAGFVNNEQFATINQDFVPLHQKLSADYFKYPRSI